MIQRLSSFLEKAYNKKVDGTGLAIFRIAYCAVLLCEIFQIFYFRHLIFDKIPFIEPAEINFGIPIFIWAISVFLIMFGLFTRTASLVNYIMSLALIGSINTYEYHVFYAYMGINFLLMFLPINRCIAIDSYLKREQGHNRNKMVSQLYYFIPLFIGLGLVYLDSVFYKLASPMWYNGLGSWMPASLPMISHMNSSLMMNNEWFIKILGYGTIFFEAVFMFLFFRKKFRVPLLFIGLGLHIGILIEFPIPWFALTACSLYILMVPVGFWKKISCPLRRIALINKGKNNLFKILGFERFIEYGETKRLNINNLYLIKIFISFSIIVQFLFLYRSLVFENLRENLGIKGSFMDRAVMYVVESTNKITKTTLGLTNHQVFTDKIHFDNYNHIIAVTYKGKDGDQWLPIINENGMPSLYNYSFNWVKWTFRVNSTNIDQKEMKKGVRDFTAFWAYKNGVDLNDATFEIKVKKISSPDEWEYNYLNKQIAQPWISGGYVKWENEKFIPYIKDIESL